MTTITLEETDIKKLILWIQKIYSCILLIIYKIWKIKKK